MPDHLSKNLKKFIGILLSTSFIFSGNLLGAFELKDNGLTSDRSELKVDFFNEFKEDNYILGPGDSLIVNISYLYPELSRNVTIDGEGTIYLPKINRIFVKGLTSAELVNLLNKAYEEYINFPDVELSISSYRPIRVFLEGEIRNPGLFTMLGAMTINENQRDGSLNYDFSIDSGTSYYFPTVFDAIRKGGGITQNSDLANIEVIRKNILSKGGGQKMTTLNFERLIRNGDDSQNIRIYDGDVIKINKSKNPSKSKILKAIKSNLNPKFIQIYITGRVIEPGSKKIPKTTTLNDAIDISGGTKILKGKVRFIRFNNDGSIDKRRISYNPRAKRGSYQNPVLSDGDLIFVGNSFLSNTSEVINEITTPFSGLFSAYGLLKLIND